jgi:hypothetical protein
MSKENERNLIDSSNKEFEEDQKDPQNKDIDNINKDKLKESNDSSRSTVMNSNIKIDEIDKSFNQMKITSEQNNKLQSNVFKNEPNYPSNFSQQTLGQNLDKENPYKKNFNKIPNNNYNFNTINFLPQNSPSFFPAFQSANNMATNIIFQPNINITKKTLLSILKDQNSTKALQNMLNENTPKETISSIVDNLAGAYLYILKDRNGNYFLSDLIKNCEQYQRIKILKELYKTISDDCIDKYATHPLQAIIDYSGSDEEYSLIMFSFTDYNKTLLASLDPNGSYVIKKIIKHIPEKHKTKFNLLFVTFIHFIITKKFGVVNAKEFVKYTKNEEILDNIATMIYVNFKAFAMNEFGIYFIQHLLEQWNNKTQGEKIKSCIIENFKELFYFNKKTKSLCLLFLSNASYNEKMKLVNTINIKENDPTLIITIMKSFGHKCDFNTNNNSSNNNSSRSNNSNNINNNQNQIQNQMENQFPISLNNNSNYNNNNNYFK